MIVHKYGGSSVSTIQKITKIAEHLHLLSEGGEEIVVVVSAMEGVTNSLASLAQKIAAHPNKREVDVLLSTGELQSAALLSIALNSLGTPSVSLSGTQAGIQTTSDHCNAFIKQVDIKKIKAHLSDKKIVIVAGFQGFEDSKDVTTLGRGGSDTTAAALASCLGCACEIYTDVEAVCAVDPKIIKNAKKLHELTYYEMMEMAVCGARVLEPRSVELACKYGVPLYLGKSLETHKSKGTWIMEKNYVEHMPIRSITQKSGYNSVVLTLCRYDTKYWSAVHKLCESLTCYEMLCSIISGEKAIFSFGVLDDELDDVKQKIQEKLGESIGALIRGGVVEIHSGLTRMSLVGIGLATHKNIAAEVCETLIENQIEYGFLSNSEISLSFTVDQIDCQRTIEVLANKFQMRG